MTKRIGLFCLSVVSLASPIATRANDIEPGKDKYTAAYTLTPITLDGKMTEWAGAGVIADPKFAVPKGSGTGANPKYVLFEEYAGGTWTGPDDQTSAVQVVYDDNNVYFGFVVTDDYHENAANSAWNGDSVQLMIANGGRTAQVALYNYALGGVEGATGDVVIMHEAGPATDAACNCATEAVIVRDGTAKKTYYEIKLPAASLGLTKLTPGTKFGLGMAINDGDELTPGQKGWGGLGAHSIVFGKSPGETAEVTLGPSKTTIEILGIGTESLLGSDLTDPENDGNEDAGPTDPSWNWASINSNVEPGFGGGEFSFNIFDNKVGGGNDKWCCDDPNPNKPYWVAVEFKQPVSLTHFTVASGNDSPDRRPNRWQIQGSNDGQNYTPIYVYDDPSGNVNGIWTENNQVAKFTLPMPTVPFRFVRYYVTDTPGSLHQIGEIEYFGTYGSSALAYYSGINPAITSFSFRVTDAGTSVVDPASIKLIIDGQNIALGTLAKVNGVVDAKYTPAVQFLPGTAHTYSITSKDGVGNNIKSEGSWTTPNYAFLQAADKVAANTSKAGFIWRVHQNEAFQNNDNIRPLQQLAGLLGDNKADPAAQGIAIAAGTPTSPGKLPVQFEIDTVINMSQVGGDSNGEFTPDDQMPGIPGTGGVNDGIAGEIITFIELPAGKTTLIVNSDDGFKTTAGNVYDIFRAQVAGEFSGGRGASDTSYDVYVAEAGIYPFRTVWEEGGGGANIEWKLVKADGTKVLINDVANGGPKAYRASTAGPATAVTSVTPAVGDTAVAPNSNVEATISVGSAAVDVSTVKLAVDGADVSAKVTQSGSIISVVFDPATDFAAPSSHTATLSFKAGTEQRSDSWKFSVPPITHDKVAQRVGFIVAGAKHSADAKGHTGKAGDYAMDFGNKAGVVNVADASFLNEGAAKDTMTFSVWEKLTAVTDASAFWANSPSSNNGTRGWQAHLPWSNGSIYFDTAGCCDADVQRINKAVDAEWAGYTDATWWQSWHHFAFVKNGATKQIFIDGQLFLEGGGGPLPTDFTNLVIGGGSGLGDNRLAGMLDDLAIYAAALTPAQVDSLAKGAAPTTITALKAWWDFNDPVVTPSGATNLKATYSNGKVTITFTGTGVIQSSDSVNTGYVDTTIKSGDQVPATGTAKFYRPKP